MPNPLPRGARDVGLIHIATILTLTGCQAPMLAPGPPYGPSPVIREVSFDASTHRRLAPGSDNWPITWADDDQQYTTWGDGGGFGGTNRGGRVSLGVARVEGPAEDYEGHNVWGGEAAANPARFGGKSYGILSVDGRLYMWVSPGSGPENYLRQTLYVSADKGSSWTSASWSFERRHGLVHPTFCQFGKDYADARDEYVYTYASSIRQDRRLAIQAPGEIVLMRVPGSAILERDRYEFFTGLNGRGEAAWSHDIAASRPVFTDPNGVGWNLSVSYNAGIGRYLLITEHSASFEGNLGIHDAGEPWGPWTTAYYGRLDENIAGRAFFYNISNKWSRRLEFVLVFTGVDRDDSWNTIRGSFALTED